MSKKLYIYDYLDNITTGHHSGGGLVIIASGDPSDAWKSYLSGLAEGHPSNRIYLDPAYIIQELPEADRVIDVSDEEEDAIYVFQDSGCC